MENERTVVLSDVHGFADRVRSVVDHYDNDVRYVFNGDAIDRGPDSKGVLDIIQETGSDLVLGNHEWVLLAALCEIDRERKWAWLQAWLMRGAQRGYEDSTLASYGLERKSNPIETAHYFKARLQSLGHLALLKSASLYYESDDLLVVHAGLASWKSWSWQQRELDSVKALADANMFEDKPQQIVNYRFSDDLMRPPDVNQTLVTGHRHESSKEISARKFPENSPKPHRVRLASSLLDGDPLFVYESWTGEVRQF